MSPRTAEFRAIREMQRESSADGRYLSFADARRAVREQQSQQEVAQQPIDAIQAQNAQLQAKLEMLEAELKSIRITGPGFSGQGARGIVFVPTDEMGAGGAGFLTLVALSSDGTDVSAVQVSASGNVIGAFEP
jgi:hypothetical protein